jgi:hypothetical protein
MSIFDIAVERDLSSPTQVIRNFKIEFRRKVSLRGNGDLLQNDYFVISLQLFRYLFRYFVISLQLFRYFVISLFRYFVISLFRYFVISLFHGFQYLYFHLLFCPSVVCLAVWLPIIQLLKLIIQSCVWVFRSYRK